MLHLGNNFSLDQPLRAVETNTCLPTVANVPRGSLLHTTFIPNGNALCIKRYAQIVDVRMFFNQQKIQAVDYFLLEFWRLIKLYKTVFKFDYEFLQ